MDPLCEGCIASRWHVDERKDGNGIEEKLNFPIADVQGATLSLMRILMRLRCATDT